MSDYRTWRGGREHRQSLVKNTKTIFQLVPRQFSDEALLGLRDLKTKGVRLGVGAGLFGAAAFFLLLLLIALVGAAIAGIATMMPMWLSALLFAALFLIILAILALVGLRWVKKAMPVVPQEAVRGVKHDVGVLRVGSGFNVASLDQQKKKDKSDKPAAGKPEKPAPVSDEDLRARISDRREHLTFLRDRVNEQADVRAQAKRMMNDPNSPASRVRAHWLPLGVATTAFTAMVVMVRKLLNRQK